LILTSIFRVELRMLSGMPGPTPYAGMVPSLPEIARAHTDLNEDDLSWLARLLADWQIIADLSFADLVLWLPDRDGSGFWAAAQMRPTTGPTALVDDVVGTWVAAGKKPLLDGAHADGLIARDGDPEWRDDVPIRVEAIPVRRADRVIAVVARNTNLHGVRTPSRLELSYLETASELTQMIASGIFPYAGQRSDHADSPRVGDGFIRVDSVGRVSYASPNALSVYRKLGLSTDLSEQNLAGITRSLIPASLRPDEETISSVLGARMPRDCEIGNGEATIIVRAIPLRPGGKFTGGLILLRDVTDLRSRDRELITKDATIREIHHRVKNNLQTVAALLRLQARRIESVSGREALEEAVRRVGAIAVVHETLSQSFEEEVEFDAVADQLIGLVSEVGAHAGSVALRRTGTFGTLSSQNAMEHGFPDGRSGTVEVLATATGDDLVIQVRDDGIGLPESFDPASSSTLGLSIVQTLVAELGGTLKIGPRVGTHGTEVEFAFGR
jgi:two-component sensor histidine kinase